MLQRSRGTLDLAFSTRNDISYAERVFQQGAMKVRFPNGERGAPPEAVILNMAGGIAGGDLLDIHVHMNHGARAVVTSQACEKIYRATAEEAQIKVTLSLDAGTALDWLPQPAIFFDGARFHRETSVDMAEDSTFTALEGMIFGRAAMGETVTSGTLNDAWFIRRGGRLIHADRFESRALANVLSGVTMMRGHICMASFRYVAPDAETRLDEMRGLLESATCEAAASAWDGMMLMRMAAPDSYTLNADLMRVLGAFRARPMPRVWSM